MKKTIILAVVLSAIVSTPLLAGDMSGGYGGAFFQVPAGARPAGMGNTYLAISNDGAAPLFNPAGLSSLQRTMFASSYRVMELDRKLGYALAMFPVQGESAIGVHWLYADEGSVAARDGDGAELGRDIFFQNHQFSIVFAKRFEKFMSLGVNLSYLYSRFPEESAAGVGFDFGAMFYLDQFINREERDRYWVQEPRVGIVVKHITKKYDWNSEGYNREFTTNPVGSNQIDNVPVEVGIGVSGRFIQRKLLTAIDITKNEKQSVILHVGGEFFLTPEFALRTGYYQGRFTAGTGYVFAIGKMALAVDYAFNTDRVNEGSEHIFSFDFLL